jgi:hypothetical protein
MVNCLLLLNTYTSIVGRPLLSIKELRTEEQPTLSLRIFYFVFGHFLKEFVPKRVQPVSQSLFSSFQYRRSIKQ